MIFVTVGTHEQPFDRLLRAVDILKQSGKIQDDVFIQTGYSTYKPQCCKWSKMLSFDSMTEKMRAARIVITHGGPASFMMPLQMKKVPIVVPRQARFGEHVNNHQVDFVRQIAERVGMIVPVYETSELEAAILRYEETAVQRSAELCGHNDSFNRDFECMILRLMERH